ncbi:MAG: ROK family protein [archaeon]|nr:ROK family protein [archaeon]MDA1167919.1 ROK family protein [archaeon]
MGSAIGIDIGGSGCRIACVDTSTGEIQGEVIRFAHDLDSSQEEIIQNIRTGLRNFPSHLPIGIGFPGMTKETMVESAPNLGKAWHGFDAEKMFATESQPVYLLNDADAAALCEYHLGCGKDGAGRMLMVTIGTGLGTGVVENGVLQPHRDLGLDPFPGRVENLETYASGRAKMIRNLDYHQWILDFNVVLHHFIERTNAQRLVLGGAICNEWNHFCHLIECQVPFQKATFVETAGIIGAALFTLQHQHLKVH